MKLQVVCRGSRREGLGHLLRTRTFARVAAASHEVAVVAVLEPELEAVLGELGQSARCVRSDTEVPSLVREYRPDVLLWDLTHVDAAAFDSVRDVPLLSASLSPIFDRAQDVNILFSRDRHASSPPDVTTFAGLEYAVFSNHCVVIDDAQYESSLAQASLPIAVCMGGTDAANKTLNVVRALVTLSAPCTIWVLLGEGYAHSYEDLVAAVRQDVRHEVILAKTNRSMWRVLANCALAILAGGLTTVEAVYAGLPAVNLFEHEAHGRMMRELFELGASVDGGPYADGPLQGAVRIVEDLNANRDELRQIRRRSVGLVDGLGSQRVLRRLEESLAQRAGAGTRRP